MRAPVQRTVTRPAEPDQVRVTAEGACGSGDRVAGAFDELIGGGRVVAGAVGAPGAELGGAGGAAVDGGVEVGRGFRLGLLEALGVGVVRVGVLPDALASETSDCVLTTSRPTRSITSHVAPDPSATTPSHMARPRTSTRGFMCAILPMEA